MFKVDAQGINLLIYKDDKTLIFGILFPIMPLNELPIIESASPSFAITWKSLGEKEHSFGKNSIAYIGRENIYI